MHQRRFAAKIDKTFKKLTRIRGEKVINCKTILYRKTKTESFFQSTESGATFVRN